MPQTPDSHWYRDSAGPSFFIPSQTIATVQASGQSLAGPLQSQGQVSPGQLLMQMPAQAPVQPQVQLPAQAHMHMHVPMQMPLQIPVQIHGQAMGQVPAQMMAHIPMQMYVVAGPVGGYSNLAPSAVPPNIAPAITAPVSAAQPGALGRVTTVMLRNIPVTYDRNMLLTDLDSRGFRGAYDFFYLPIDFQTGNNIGYAFVNLVSEAEVARFRTTYQGLQLSADRSNKICAVCDAQKQGLHQNVEHYRNSPVMGMEEQYHPMVFENGVRRPFPGPTRPLKQVRQRTTRANG